MKNLTLVLLFAALVSAASLMFASFAFAAPAAKSWNTSQQRASSACVPALRDQLELDNTNAQHLMSTSYADGLKQGLILGAGTTLFLVGLVAVNRKITRSTKIRKQPLTQAASA